jgi:hypothetical protein
MPPHAPTLSPVKITLERWLQDKAEAVGLPFGELAGCAGMTARDIRRKPRSGIRQVVTSPSSPDFVTGVSGSLMAPLNGLPLFGRRFWQ